MSVAIAWQLTTYAKTVDSPLLKSYRNSIVCSGVIAQKDGRLTTRFCGNRWCLVCGSIRTARAWIGYQPIIQRWVDKNRAYFVTLTIPNPRAGALDAAVDEMIAALRQAKDRMRKCDGVKLVALRKLECTYNIERDDYHPHLHLIVYGRRAAHLLRGEWLARFPEAKEIAQHITRADKGSVAEMFKYFTKLITKTKRRDGEPGARRLVPPAALDIIFRMMKGRRVYQPIGVRKMKADDESQLILDKGTVATGSRATETVMWEWLHEIRDWVDLSTGDCLTGYEPDKGFRAFVDAIC